MSETLKQETPKMIISNGKADYHQVVIPILEWRSDPLNFHRILASSVKMPGTTLFEIDIREDRDDRGWLYGAFIPDEIEKTDVFSNAKVRWLKAQAEFMLREFLIKHEGDEILERMEKDRNRWRSVAEQLYNVAKERRSFKKSCGHDFDCVCNSDAEKAALAAFDSLRKEATGE